MSTLARPVSILVVEDNDADADMILDGFTETGADVRVRLAGDGSQAWAILRGGEAAETPDLIFMDLNLPRQGGLELLAELKVDPELRTVPVVVLTTSKSQREIVGSYEAGAAAVLNKPMRLADHRAMMQAVVAFWLGHVRLPRRGL
jgi:two-component system, chemotaxis family, response regulator Rcp1